MPSGRPALVANSQWPPHTRSDAKGRRAFSRSFCRATSPRTARRPARQLQASVAHSIAQSPRSHLSAGASASHGRRRRCRAHSAPTTTTTVLIANLLHRSSESSEQRLSDAHQRKAAPANGPLLAGFELRPAAITSRLCEVQRRATRGLSLSRRQLLSETACIGCESRAAAIHWVDQLGGGGLPRT